MTEEDDKHIDTQLYQDSKQDEHDQEEMKEIPANDLDMQWNLVEPGLQRVKKGFRSKLKVPKGEARKYYLVDKNGNAVIDAETKLPVTREMQDYDDLAGYLQFWVRDFRLGNLSQWSGEYEHVIHHVNLAIDLLTDKYPRAGLSALNKALSVQEVSNSKNARVRELIQTIRRESAVSSDDNSKPSFQKAHKMM
jgi:hypothetical protein